MSFILSAQCKAIARPSIGSLKTVELPFLVGTPISEVVKGFAPILPATFWIDGGVVIIDDGAPLPFELWHEVTIALGQAISLVVLPQGESGRLIAQIAIVAASAAAYMIPGVGPFVSAAIGIGGTFALNYFFAPKAKKPKPPKQFGEGGFSGNTLEAYQQIPTLLGRRRCSPNYGHPPYSERDKENVTSKAIILMSGQVRISNPEENGSPLETHQEYYYEGDASDHELQIFTKTVWQEPGRDFARHAIKTDTTTDRRRELAHSPTSADVTKYDLPKWQWFRLNQVLLPERVDFDIHFTRGVYKTSDEKAGVPFRLGLKLPDGSIIDLPEVHLIANSQSQFYAKIKFLFTADPTGGTAPSSSSAWRVAFHDSDHQIGANTEADAYYEAGGAVTADHVYVEDSTTLIIYVDPNIVPVTLGMSIGIMCGAGYYNDRFDATTGEYQFNGGVAFDWDFFGRINNSGVYEAIEDQSKAITECTLEYVTRYYDRKPLNITGQYAALEVETQNQNSQQFSVFAERMIDKKWENGAWIDAPHVSENAGEQAFDIVTNGKASLNNLPVDPTLLNAASFGAYATHCFEKNYTSNPYIPSGNVEQALQWCMDAGRGWLVRNDLWEIYIDRDRSADSPDMVFSPRNYNSFRFDKVWEDEVHAVRVLYDNRADDYQTDPTCVCFGPGHDKYSATLYEEINAPWCVERWQAEEYGNFWLRDRFFRDRRYAIVTNPSQLVIKRGSLVGLNHYILNQYHGAAAVRTVHRRLIGADTKIVGVTLDGFIDLRPTTTGFTLTSYDSQIITASTVQAGSAREVWFDTPLDDDDALDEGCTLTSGDVGLNFIRCLVKDIQPERNGGARLTLIDEAPQIFGHDDLYASPDLYGEVDLYNLNQ